MSTKNDPAFPIVGTPNYPGLTRLEYFAGCALNQYADTDYWSRFDELAKHCFDLAEAMILESERRSK